MSTDDTNLFVPTNAEAVGEIPFSVAARVALQLGRESISNSITAITELVKNAYDADAEIVKIRFSDLQTDTPAVLVIEDDGNGMTERQLRDQWMLIGTLNKVSSIRSREKRRLLTGEKGLGRLGLDRLCREAIIQTFSKKKDRGTALVIQWEKYNYTEEHIGDIKHKVYRIPKLVPDPITGERERIDHGTRLILLGLKDQWSKEYLSDLKKELTLLVSPFEGINDFSIEIESGYDEIDGEVVSSDLLKAAKWILESSIDSDGSISHRMYSYQHDQEYEFPSTPWREVFRDAKSETPQCGPLSFKLYFFLRDRVRLENISLSRSQVREFLNANQGIRIYRDFFRVKPYGSPDGTGDWLTLSYRRQQNPQAVSQEPLGGWKVGYNQVVGAAFISREKNPDLVDQTNREGIVEEPAFYDLRKFALHAVGFFELNRQRFVLSNQEENTYEKVKSEAEKSSIATTEAVNRLRTAIEKGKKIVDESQRLDKSVDLSDTEDLLEELRGATEEVSSRLSESQRAQEELTRATEEEKRTLQRQKDTLGNLASLGILTTTFGHETLGSSNVVKVNARGLQKDMNDGLFMILPDYREEIEYSLDTLVHEADKIHTFAKFTLRNVNRDKRYRRNVFLDDVVHKVFSFFENSLRHRSIDVEINTPETMPPLLAFEIDWESIIVNFITNSVWALQDTPATERKIRVSLKVIDEHIILTFADSGWGIESGTEDNIFLPTFSTKRNEKGDVIGTGMGLAIVKDFVESYDCGEVIFESPCDLGGAEFEVRVRVVNRSRD